MFDVMHLHHLNQSILPQVPQMGQVVGLTTTPGPIWWKSRGEIRYAPGYEVESTVRGPPPGVSDWLPAKVGCRTNVVRLLWCVFG